MFSEFISEVAVDEALEAEREQDLIWAGVQSTDGNYSEPLRQKDLRLCVESLLEGVNGQRISLERRIERRFSYHKPVTITPIDDRTGKPDISQSFNAFGIDISTTGISFLSPQLVPSRQAVITCHGRDKEPVSVLFLPRWVRFTRRTWYQIGGRLVQVLPETIELPTREQEPA